MDEGMDNASLCAKRETATGKATPGGEWFKTLTM
jgi:hypothetical protein